MADVLTGVSTRKTPQFEKARPEQIKNAAGGYTFQAGDEARLHRFLTLGTSDSTYYTSAKELTRDNAQVLFRAVAADPLKVVRQIVEISTAGRAPKQNPGLFALAVVAGCDSDEGRRAALHALPQVARTGSTLFTFVKYMEQFRGWGRGARDAVSRWYDEKPVDRVAYQVLKYRMRDDWRHDDLLRVAHPSGAFTESMPEESGHKVLYNWLAATSPTRGSRRLKHGDGKDINGEPVDLFSLPKLVDSFIRLKAAVNKRDVIAVLLEDHNVSWEMIPDAFINDPDVWEVLLGHGVPQTALMRQLPRLTNIFGTNGVWARNAASQLVDSDRLIKARVHPINVLVAQKTYAQGHGEKGSLSWTPNRLITDALDQAFYAAYRAVEPSGKRLLLALDVSGSMGFSNCSGVPLTPREATAALSLVTANTEQDWRVIGFTSHRGRGWSPSVRTRGVSRYGGGDAAVTELDITPRRRLDDVVRYVAALPFGGTDVSLPMLWAAEKKVPVDCFSIYTDNETWAGAMHPHQALEHYRQTMGIDAKMVVSAMTATGNSVCDPNDARQLDISGFDSACPQLIADFAANRV